LGLAWGVFRGESCCDVAIRFWGPAAKVVAETNWHRTQQSEVQANGDVILRFKVEGLEEILWWLMSWAPFARVEEPIELRIRLVEELTNGIKANS
jgi:proteasome accessory factor B